MAKQSPFGVENGGMNLLGKEDVWDNLIRVDNSQAAAELMEISEMAVSEGEKS